MPKALTLLVVSLASAAFGNIVGSGRIVTEQRPVPGFFDGVGVHMGIHANVTIGKQASITVTGDDNILKALRFKLEDHKLEFRTVDDESIHPSKDIVVNIVTPELHAVEATGGAVVIAQASSGPSFAVDASGGSRVVAQPVRAEAVAISASGGSEVTVSGSGHTVAIEMSGGSAVRAYDIAAESATVDGSGGCRGYLHVTDNLTADLSGGTELHLRSAPRTQTVNASGGSEVRVDQKG